MNYEEFKKEFKNRILSYLPLSYSGWKVNIQTVYKVNMKLDGISVIPPKESEQTHAVYPVFYLQDFFEMYENGVALNRILRHVSGIIVNTPVSTEFQSSYFDIENFKDRIVFQLINRELNRELLKTLPHREFLDLAVIYRILIMEDDGYTSGMIVTKDIMKEWEVSEKDLFDSAWNHTPEVLPFQLKSVGQFFQGSASEEGCIFMRMGRKAMQISTERQTS